MSDLYDGTFYTAQRAKSQSSADIIVPLIIEAISPSSVVDIGCGVGHWPLAFAKNGVDTAHGVDGPWAAKSGVVLPPGSFFEFDFENSDQPFTLPLPRQRYDLVTSFEFAEHISERFSDGLVDLFCSLSDVVVLGAAIPFQGGLHHVNERWPAYWAEKFQERGFEACDFVRPNVWNTAIEPWYAQNSIAYFKGGVPEAAKRLADKGWNAVASGAFPLVHPELWISKSLKAGAHGPSLSRRLSQSVKAAIERIKR